MELVFIILIVGSGIYLYIRNKNRAAFSFDENAVLLYKRNQLYIEFDKITKIERHYATTFQTGAYMFFKYFIHYVNSDGNEEVATMLVSTADLSKWRRLKEQLLSKNPVVKIDENIL